ncbi:hypothetical protein MMC06_000622 [Schaereria dolodes]|nr:hypothetical protein [Schaereria dolodes]
MSSQYARSLFTATSSRSSCSSSSSTIAEPLPAHLKAAQNRSSETDDSGCSYAASVNPIYARNYARRGAIGGVQRVIGAEANNKYLTSSVTSSSSSNSSIKKSKVFIEGVCHAPSAMRHSAILLPAGVEPKPATRLTLVSIPKKKAYRSCVPEFDFTYRNVYTSGNVGNTSGHGKATVSSANSSMGQCVLM